ncbi:hypothetical protein FRUB_08144 [Fimbriiglobus ruber]|uniref:Cytochrome c domain-containing protein n=1 Tax=Fimbriiglobus ruber TaxID=1908690 RepID=A0A225D1X6_9BACT|nr:hypothetical protein FRUB_08144 [Fimbriiglobus ruber]
MFLSAGLLAVAAPPDPPDLPDGTDKALKAMAALRAPAGFRVELYAAEPKLASPVAISIDEKNRVYVAEEYRFNQGTEENRTRGFFLEDDLQISTLDDRLRMYQKHASKFQGGMEWFTRHADQVRLLEDTTGSGRADKSTVFAGGFNGTLDGLAAGVLARDGNVYLTCIPNLWLLKDTKGTGTANVRTKLLTGFGVNCGFLGHDLHGLTFGPDGKLYFSVGDRGFHVRTKENTTLSGPRTGGVFRCNPDGTELEVIHRGLRNPQELAFDQYGNLFADDNNCDRGDMARLVYVVDDGETGWNMAYQTIPDPYTAGPWFAERLWHAPHAGQPAYIVPPVGKIGNGPSGFTFTSGTSMPDRYKNAFFMADYVGNGGIESFRVVPKGAGFEIADYHDFLKPFSSTDVEFGYDGKMYVSDFVQLLWGGGSGGGRIYTVFDPARLADPVVQETKELFAKGFKQRGVEALTALLDHPDQRVRQRAQFALVERAAQTRPGANPQVIVTAFLKTAYESKNQLARIHAIWGLGQVGRTVPQARNGLPVLLADKDPEIRAQAAKVIGGLPTGAATEAAPMTLVELLKDENPRVKFFAAQALGKLKHAAAVGPLFDVIRANADADPYLRHACVAALTRIADKAALDARATDASGSVRLAVVLVERRLKDERLVRFLTDKDPLVRIEAARAIHDLPLEDLYPALADQLPSLAATPVPDGDALVRRCINAAYRLGGPDRAKAVLAVATSSHVSRAVRAEALAALREWANPPKRDRVTGFWHPLDARDAGPAKEAVEAGLADLLGKTSDKLQVDAIGLILALGVKADPAKFAEWAVDAKKEPGVRAAALRFLAGQKAKQLAPLLTDALKDTSPVVRAEARDIVAQSDATRGAALFSEVLEDAKAPAAERQRAVAGLAAYKSRDASAQLDALGGQLADGTAPADLQLDILDALKAAPNGARNRARDKYDAALPKDPVGKRRASLAGGDADRGRDVFFNHTAAQCVRCHTVKGVGGTAGPDLTKVVERHPEKTREFLLESLILPSAQIAQGFASVTLTLADGRLVAGTLVAEDKKSVTIQTPDGKKQSIPTDDIDKRTAPVSPMPSVETTLTPRELRDLIEFLTTLK